MGLQVVSPKVKDSKQVLTVCKQLCCPALPLHLSGSPAARSVVEVLLPSQTQPLSALLALDLNATIATFGYRVRLTTRCNLVLILPGVTTLARSAFRSIIAHVPRVRASFGSRNTPGTAL